MQNLPLLSGELALERRIEPRRNAVLGVTYGLGTYNRDTQSWPARWARAALLKVVVRRTVHGREHSVSRNPGNNIMIIYNSAKNKYHSICLQNIYKLKSVDFYYFHFKLFRDLNWPFSTIYKDDGTAVFQPTNGKAPRVCYTWLTYSHCN